MKKLLKKYESLNEQSFSEFISYYNSQVFKHNIEHFDVFLQACAKVCVLKKTSSAEGKVELKIMLKKQVLKDVLCDPQFNYGLPMKLPLKPQTKVEMPKFQMDMFTQLLELFIFQTKGFRMEFIKQLKGTPSPTAPGSEFLKISDD